MNNERVRAFLAIDLPSAVKEEIGKIQERLKVPVNGIRWVKPEGIHLTLKFFGDISQEEIAAISPVVEKAAAGIRPLSLSVGNLGVFPGVSRPRVLWIGMNGDLAVLSALQQEIETGLASRGFKKEERTFTPHLTLGRIRSPREVSGLDKALAKREDYQAGRFTAEGLTLFKSDLTREGAIYSALAYFPFGEKDRT